MPMIAERSEAARRSTAALMRRLPAVDEGRPSPSNDSPGTAPLTYRPELDGLRAFAIMIVVIFHAGCPWLQGGFVGVDVFFVLSGFLITSILHAEIEATNRIDYRRFLTRRALRLLPALWLMIGVYLATTALGANFRMHLGDAALAATYTANFARAAGTGRPGLLGHTWSLSIEEQFYLCWPLLLFAVVRLIRSPGRRVAVVFCLACLSAIHRAISFYVADAGFDRIYNGPDTHADGLLLGCATALFIGNGGLRIPERLCRVWPAIATVGLIVLAAAGRTSSGLMATGGLLAASVLAATIIVCLVHPFDTIARRCFASSPFVFFGKISYGLYLWHYPVMKSIERYGDWRQTLLVGGAVSVAAAVFSFYAVERPFLRLKRRFEFQRSDLGNAGVDSLGARRQAG